MLQINKHSCLHLQPTVYYQNLWDFMSLVLLQGQDGERRYQELPFSSIMGVQEFSIGLAYP